MWSAPVLVVGWRVAMRLCFRYPPRIAYLPDSQSTPLWVFRCLIALLSSVY
jgi:hypothetical protein